MDEKIAQFTEITGATPEQADFFLQSADGNLETAMSTFFESGGAASSSAAAQAGLEETESMNEDISDHIRDEQMDADSTSASISQPDPPAEAPSAGGGRTLGGANVASASFTAPTTTPAPSGSSKKASAPQKKFGTLSSLGGNDDDDEDENKKRDLFAGGEKSGLNVLDPNAGRKKDDEDDEDGPNEMVRNLLKKAAQGSASRAEQEEATQKKAASSSSAFSGSGFTLGATGGDETQATGASTTAGSGAPAGGNLGPLGSMMPGGFPGLRGLFGGRAAPPRSQLPEGQEVPEDYEEESVTRHLTLWRDGFSVEDGPLLRYDDPQHMATLQAIQNGTAPEHVLNVRFGQQVELRVAKRTGEDYVPPPKKPAKPFSGQGATLGSSSSTAASAPAQPAPAAATSASTSQVFEIDQSAPVTTLQIRLGDGSRQRAQFNQETHTVADIRRWINAGNPGMSGRNYVLMTAFPNKELADESLTIKDAGLMGSVVTQKWK